MTGLGCRVTAAGHRAFVLTYYNRAGVQRRYTIGDIPDWSTTGAREEARRLKRLIDTGGDPLEEIAAERGAATVDDLTIASSPSTSAASASTPETVIAPRLNSTSGRRSAA